MSYLRFYNFCVSPGWSPSNYLARQHLFQLSYTLLILELSISRTFKASFGTISTLLFGFYLFHTP